MKIALVAPNALHIKVFWLALIRTLISKGNIVHVYSAHDDVLVELQQFGLTCRAIPINRFVSPATDLHMLWNLYRTFKRERYDIVHNFTIKANVFGALAARAAGCPRIVNMVLGLGTAFSQPPTIRGRLLRLVASFLYRLGFAACTKACLVNRDNLEEVLRRGLIAECKTVLIRSGIGVDLQQFSVEAISAAMLQRLRNDLGLEPDAPVVLMAGRLFWGKGVREFIEAAEQLEADFPQVRFLLVGPAEAGSSDSVPQSYLDEHLNERIRWLGFRADMPQLMALSDIFVLPSYYGEGLPQVLLEAGALSKPIVTTDNVGCREAVVQNWNGYLIPVRNAAALRDALRPLLADRTLREKFGANSRQLVERDFDKRMVVDHILRKLYEMPEG